MATDSTQSEEFHVTQISERGVYGHTSESCDDGDCAAGADVFFAEVDPGEVEEGHIYQITLGGEVIAEVIV